MNCSVLSTDFFEIIQWIILLVLIFSIGWLGGSVIKK